MGDFQCPVKQRSGATGHLRRGSMTVTLILLSTDSSVCSVSEQPGRAVLERASLLTRGFICSAMRHQLTRGALVVCFMWALACLSVPSNSHCVALVAPLHTPGVALHLPKVSAILICLSANAHAARPGPSQR